MVEPRTENRSAAGLQRRTFYFNGGFLRATRLRRILSLAGHPLQLGWPRSSDCIAVWGKTAYARRGEAVARRTGAALIRVEDAWLRSIHPGRKGEPPLGLLIDRSGIHFDPDTPSDLEQILATHPLDDPDLLRRAGSARARIMQAELSKYNNFELTSPAPTSPASGAGYVLVIDQSRDDASIRYGHADAETFRQMLQTARADHPDKQILIKTHPEASSGLRPGYFGPADQDARTTVLTDPVSPWTLFAGAAAVYVVSSQLGFEYILSGGTPDVFGLPFYAGWGLSRDHHAQPLPRRGRQLQTDQLFAAAMILYPVWYDPCRDRLCELETAIDLLEAQVRAWREDHNGWTAYGMRLWKRKPLQKFFGQIKPLRFAPQSNDGTGRAMVWANKADQAPAAAVRLEDGFIRSRGLGAELIPPLSLVLDDLGIYYDPTRTSRLEQLIADPQPLSATQSARVATLRAQIISHRLSKYNLQRSEPSLPAGHRILVPSQVEDDASIRLGAGAGITTNLKLLETVRQHNPDAIVLYKPHPDVEAGLRTGHVPTERLGELADAVLSHADPAWLLSQVDEVWTMTSLMGFEALIRDVPVVTTGAPFYAGWGLTRDLGDIPARRQARPGLDKLIHATLIDYPRYYDPVTGQACPVEVVLDRLINNQIPTPGPGNRLLAKLQGLFASWAWLWR